MNSTAIKHLVIFPEGFAVKPISALRLERIARKMLWLIPFRISAAIIDQT
jgi:hypothetical protein